MTKMWFSQLLTWISAWNFFYRFNANGCCHPCFHFNSIVPIKAKYNKFNMSPHAAQQKQVLKICKKRKLIVFSFHFSIYNFDFENPPIHKKAYLHHRKVGSHTKHYKITFVFNLSYFVYSLDRYIFCHTSRNIKKSK